MDILKDFIQNGGYLDREENEGYIKYILIPHVYSILRLEYSYLTIQMGGDADSIEEQKLGEEEWELAVSNLKTRALEILTQSIA